MVTHWWNLFIGIDIYLLHNVRYTIINRKPYFGPNGRTVTSQTAPNRISTSAFGFSPYTIRGCLAGHFSVKGALSEVFYFLYIIQYFITEVVAKKFDRPVAEIERKMRAALCRLKEMMAGLD